MRKPAPPEPLRARLWALLRICLREDAGWRPEFQLGSLPPGGHRRIYAYLADRARSVSRPWTEAESGDVAFFEHLDTAPPLPSVGVIFHPGEADVFWTHEHRWDERTVFAFLDLLVELRRELPGATFTFAPYDPPEPFAGQTRAALADYGLTPAPG
jgi:hypothetical protein